VGQHDLNYRRFFNHRRMVQDLLREIVGERWVERIDFDSGELGFGPQGFTAAANRATWDTPKRLKPGTYTYFCRVHPFMRGAFKVKPKA